MLQFNDEIIQVNINGKEYVGDLSEIDDIASLLMEKSKEFDGLDNIDEFREAAREFVDTIFYDGVFDDIFEEYTATYTRILQVITLVLGEIRKFIEIQNKVAEDFTKINNNKVSAMKRKKRPVS